MEITYGIYNSPFGWCMIGIADRRVCFLSFIKSKSASEGLKNIRTHWPEGKFTRSDIIIAPYGKKIFRHEKARPSLDLLVKGTDFQMKVWDALLAIPEGKTTSYAAIARAIKSPKAVRAVGTACGKNSIPFLIPCHRVLTSTGGIGGYNGGITLKKKILAWENVDIASNAKA
jgi:AraC family transcriptional regulator, regulatory protein of adaptative response / methylated-DNA-[protein]-cysteine methyltransferase